MMIRLALALLAMLGTAHAAALVQIGQDDDGHAVIGGPGGVQGAKPQTAWDVPAFNQPPPPPQQPKPAAKPTAAPQQAP